MNRVNLNEYLNNLGLDYYDPMEILLKKKTVYSGDPLKVVPYRERKVVSFEEFKKGKKKEMVKNVLSSIANGDKFIEKYSYKEIICKFNDYMMFYKNNVKRSCSMNKVGRPKKIVSEGGVQILNMYRNKEISLQEALNITGYSRRTFFRKLKEYINKI